MGCVFVITSLLSLLAGSIFGDLIGLRKTIQTIVYLAAMANNFRSQKSGRYWLNKPYIIFVSAHPVESWRVEIIKYLSADFQAWSVAIKTSCLTGTQLAGWESSTSCLHRLHFSSRGIQTIRGRHTRYAEWKKEAGPSGKHGGLVRRIAILSKTTFLRADGWVDEAQMYVQEPEGAPMAFNLWYRCAIPCRTFGHFNRKQPREPNGVHRTRGEHALVGEPGHQLILQPATRSNMTWIRTSHPHWPHREPLKFCCKNETWKKKTSRCSFWSHHTRSHLFY